MQISRIHNNASFLRLPTYRCIFIFIFFILFSKVHADAKNDLQYCRGKLATKSEMSLKIDLKFDFESNTSKTHRLSRKNCTINEPKMGNFHDSFTHSYKIFFCFVLNIMHGWGAVYFITC